MSKNVYAAVMGRLKGRSYNPRMDQITLKNDADVVAAWKTALALARRVGFGPFKQACLTSLVLELSRHVVEGGEGACELSDASDARARRARLVVTGRGADFVERARRRLNAETAIAPALPAVQLGQIVETCGLEPRGDGARVELTVHEAKAAVSVRAARPLARAGGRW